MVFVSSLERVKIWLTMSVRYHRIDDWDPKVQRSALLMQNISLNYQFDDDSRKCGAIQCLPLEYPPWLSSGLERMIQGNRLYLLSVHNRRSKHLLGVNDFDAILLIQSLDAMTKESPKTRNEHLRLCSPLGTKSHSRIHKSSYIHGSSPRSFDIPAQCSHTFPHDHNRKQHQQSNVQRRF